MAKARKRRLARLRLMALPTLRLAVRPYRISVDWGDGALCNTNPDVTIFWPTSATDRNSDRFFNRFREYNGYADKRLRPLARRALNTLRPPVVAIRARKPWSRLRFRLVLPANGLFIFFSLFLFYFFYLPKTGGIFSLFAAWRQAFVMILNK